MYHECEAMRGDCTHCAKERRQGLHDTEEANPRMQITYVQMNDDSGSSSS